MTAFLSKPFYRSKVSYLLRELSGEREPEELPSLDPAPDYAGRRVLLVEDNDLNLEIAAELLRMTGATVEAAKNGMQALECFARSADGYYNVILMDIQMPVMNGYEAAEAIRSEGAQRPDLLDLPIVAFSANAFSEDACRSRAAGMNDHLAKPIQIGELAEVLKKWL